MSGRRMRFRDGRGRRRTFGLYEQAMLERRSRLPNWCGRLVRWKMDRPGVWLAYGPWGLRARLTCGGRPSCWELSLRDVAGEASGCWCKRTMREIHAVLRDAWRLEPRESFEPMGAVRG